LLIPVRTMQSDLEAAMEITSVPGFKTLKKYAFVVLETGDVPESFFDNLATLGPIAPVRFTCRAQEIDWEPIEQSHVFLGKTLVLKREQKTISSEAVSEGEAVWKWLANNFELPQPRPVQSSPATKEERDAQLAALYNNLRRTIPPQLAAPVHKIGGQQADVIMMLMGVIDGTMRLYIDQDKHLSQLEFLFSKTKETLFKK
jgi:hypothetical protein